MRNLKDSDMMCDVAQKSWVWAPLACSYITFVTHLELEELATGLQG